MVTKHFSVSRIAPAYPHKSFLVVNSSAPAYGAYASFNQLAGSLHSLHFLYVPAEERIWPSKYSLAIVHYSLKAWMLISAQHFRTIL